MYKTKKLQVNLTFTLLHHQIRRIKKLLGVCVLLCYGACNLFAQNGTTDSLKQLLATSKEDTSRVLLLNNIARTYIYSKPDSAILLAVQALDLSQKIHFSKGEMLVLNVMGNVFVNTGNYPRALEVYLRGLKIAEEINDGENMGRIMGGLGDLYFYLGDLKRSLDYSHQALLIHEKFHNNPRINIILINIGDTYEKSNQLDSAMFYTRRAYLMALSLNNVDNKSICLNNLGNIFLKLGKPDSAMAYYKSAIPLFKQANNDAGFCETSLGIAKIFLIRQNRDSCLYYAKLSFNTAEEGGFMEQALAASIFLEDYYKSAGNVDSAYAYQSATIVAKDSLFSQQKVNQVQNMTYDESMRQQQIEEAKAQERVRLKQNVLVGGLAALLIVAFLLYINNRQKRKANVQLQKQKEEIDRKAHELSVQKENLQQSYNNVEQLGEIGRKITSSLSVEKIIGTVYDNVNALMDASVFGIGIYNSALQRIEFPATYENGQALPFYYNSLNDQNRFPVICFKECKEIIIGNLDEEYLLHMQQVQRPREGKQPVSLIYLPLVVKEKKLGVITVQGFHQNAYSEYHLFMLRNIAIYTAIALENAESFETLNQTLVRLKSTQAQLVHSEKMASLGELTAGIAHEIQNPLNFVNNFSEINKELIDELKSDWRKPEQERDKESEDEILNVLDKNLEKIFFHGNRADAIVKGMLQHSRTNTGIKEPADINKLADEYLRLSYHGLRAKDKSFNAEFKTDFDESIGKINIVSQDIGRMLLNLINNAFYAVSERRKAEGEAFKPKVSVQTKKINALSGEEGIEIVVSDNGTGIPKNIIDKIFQPFFTTKPTGDGTGLGLSLVYDIVTKEHNGTIKVQSKQGEGTEFTVHLPSN